MDRAGVLFLSTERNGTTEVDRDDLRSTCPTPSFSKQGQLKKVVLDHAQYLGARSSYLGRKILFISYLGRNTSCGYRISIKSFILLKKKKKKKGRGIVSSHCTDMKTHLLIWPEGPRSPCIYFFWMSLIWEPDLNKSEVRGLQFVTMVQWFPSLNTYFLHHFVIPVQLENRLQLN